MVLSHCQPLVAADRGRGSLMRSSLMLHSQRHHVERRGSHPKMESASQGVGLACPRSTLTCKGWERVRDGTDEQIVVRVIQGKGRLLFLHNSLNPLSVPFE